MTVYICKTQNGIWVKANQNDQESKIALKIWWTTHSNSVIDYLDRALTSDRKFPVYAILSLGKPDEAAAKFKVAMADMKVKAKVLNHMDFHSMIIAGFEE